MRSAAELEDATEKHNITPGPIATARELSATCWSISASRRRPCANTRRRSSCARRFKALHGVARAAELGG